MLVSLKWLKDYVDIDVSVKELSDRLTMAGLEVDAIREISPGFNGVVVAQVLSVQPHPNADKLSLCEVSIGDRTYPVVCGAPNVKKGMLTAFAQVGAEIPGGYKIKSTKIRGEQSEGMLCSEEELGIGEDAAGIMSLADNLKLGEDLATALKLTDTVFDIGITPNRSDCLSIIGIAREIAAITGGEFRSPEIRISESVENISTLTSVRIMDPDLCPRYVARMIKNIKIGPSPAWLRMRLESIGLRAINNIVDITNFVMMEMGQPLHAFDFRYLEEGRIVVRRAEEGEQFISLDGKTRTLCSDTLMICDGIKPVAVAGVMGGLNSEVQDDTDTVLLESAYFNPSSIRRTSKRLGMGTDAAYRFERGIDPEGLLRAADRAAQLMAELSGGEVVNGYIDEYPLKIEQAGNIILRTERVKAMLGASVKTDEIRKILSSLGMNIEEREFGFSVTPPSYRVDIAIETDLIEEIARLHGYERIPESLPEIKIQPDQEVRKRALDFSRDVLTSDGYTEVINYSFTSPVSAEVLMLADSDERRNFVHILNPLTEDQSIMRTTLIYGLLQNLQKNLNVGNTNVRIFEKGRVFIGKGTNVLPLEKEKICGLISGTRYESLWAGKGESVDFYAVKGAVEKLFEILRTAGVSYIASSSEPFLHPGRACKLVRKDEPVGFIGEIHPDVLMKLDIKAKALVFEIDFDSLISDFQEKLSFKEIPRFPPSFRDASFLVNRDLEAEQIINLAGVDHQELLEKIEIFDVYMGKNIPENAKSIALRFTYRSPEKTLTDDDVNPIHTNLVKKIADATGAKIRGES
jgi:phenylalanyl-tRNA synthetase beta chain